MPDKALHGNGDNCPACELRRDELRTAGAWKQEVECNYCGGEGRLARAVADIVREHVEHARAHYWPEREARWAKQNG